MKKVPVASAHNLHYSERRRTLAGDRLTEPFSLEFQDDQEIWVKHRISGHIVCFPISDGGEWIEDLHRINLDASSAYDGSQLIPSARRAAREYLQRSRAFSVGDRSVPGARNV
jgi:hypothetical protein